MDCGIDCLWNDENVFGFCNCSEKDASLSGYDALCNPVPGCCVEDTPGMTIYKQHNQHQRERLQDLAEASRELRHISGSEDATTPERSEYGRYHAILTNLHTVPSCPSCQTIDTSDPSFKLSSEPQPEPEPCGFTHALTSRGISFTFTSA